MTDNFSLHLLSLTRRQSRSFGCFDLRGPYVQFAKFGHSIFTDESYTRSSTTTTQAFETISRESGVNQAFDSVPDWLVAHELTHIYQFTSTTAGLRCMFNHGLQWHRSGVLTRGLVNKLGYIPSGVARHLIEDDTDDVLELIGGAIVEDGSNMSLLRGAFYLPEEYLDLEIGPEGVALTSSGHIMLAPSVVGEQHRKDDVLLFGEHDLIEGQANAVETLRHGLSPQGNSEFEKYRSSGIPYSPYRYCKALYSKLLGRNLEPRDFVDLTIMIDAALMAVQFPEEFTLSSASVSSDDGAAGYFYEMVQLAASSSSLHIDFDGPVDGLAIRRLASNYLDAVGASITRIEEASERLLDIVPVVAQSYTMILGGDFDHVSDLESHLERNIRLRLQNGGIGTGALTAMMPSKHLRNACISASAGPLMRGEMEGILANNAYDIGGVVPKILFARHADAIWTEVLYGSAKCPDFNRCALPRRTACYGVTTEVRPDGSECFREYVIDCFTAHPAE